jgi:hypothetical protein
MHRRKESSLDRESQHRDREREKGSPQRKERRSFETRSSRMVHIERLLNIIQTVFASVGIHEFLVPGHALLLFSHGELLPRFNLVVVVVAGEACMEID